VFYEQVEKQRTATAKEAENGREEEARNFMLVFLTQSTYLFLRNDIMLLHSNDVTHVMNKINP